MQTANLSLQQAVEEFASTSTTSEQLLEALKSSAEYRQAFVEEAIRSRLTVQINALRSAEGWDHKTFAERLGKTVSWVYRLEDPNVSAPTIPTLLSVAAALDIGLDVRFRRFSELVDDVTTLSPESFGVPSFAAELQSGAFNHSPRKRRRHGLKLVRGSRRGGRRKISPGTQQGHSFLLQGGFGQQSTAGANYGIQKAG